MDFVGISLFLIVMTADYIYKTYQSNLYVFSVAGGLVRMEVPDAWDQGNVFI